jgi:hypothetical protein
MFNLDTSEQVTLVEVLRIKPRAYFAVSANTLNHPFADIKSLLIDHTRYQNSFKYILRSILISQDDTITGKPTLFFVAGTGIASTWFLGDADSVYSDSSGIFTISLEQNHDTELNTAWKDSCGGLIRIGYIHFSLQWWVRDMGDNKTRIALVAYVIPDDWVPRWLFRIVSRVVFPRCVQDVELKLDEKR